MSEEKKTEVKREVKIQTEPVSDYTNEEVKCPFSNCEIVMSFKELKNHKTTCPQRIITCTCGEAHKFNDVNHKARCKDEIESCCHCKKPYQRKFMENHMISCDDKPMKCPHAPCRSTVLYKNYKNHVDDYKFHYEIYDKLYKHLHPEQTYYSRPISPMPTNNTNNTINNNNSTNNATNNTIDTNNRQFRFPPTPINFQRNIRSNIPASPQRWREPQNFSEQVPEQLKRGNFINHSEFLPLHNNRDRGLPPSNNAVNFRVPRESVPTPFSASMPSQATVPRSNDTTMWQRRPRVNNINVPAKSPFTTSTGPNTPIASPLYGNNGIYDDISKLPDVGKALNGTMFNSLNALNDFLTKECTPESILNFTAFSDIPEKDPRINEEIAQINSLLSKSNLNVPQQANNETKTGFQFPARPEQPTTAGFQRPTFEDGDLFEEQTEPMIGFERPNRNYDSDEEEILDSSNLD